MNSLARNTPVACVYGGAGFLGSHLVEKLVQKGIFTIVVDNFSTGSKNNLKEIADSSLYTILNYDTKDLVETNIPKLNYAFFAITPNIDKASYIKAFESFLKVCVEFKPKIVFISTIELYDPSLKNLEHIQRTESLLASYSLKYKLNARVVRLANLYGPRMYFNNNDPISKLLKSAAEGSIQKEVMPLDFITRSLYIDDAVDLILRTLFHGGTAHKIYDGCLLHPIKISEIRQVLMDLSWYERIGFTPTLLPAWPTPNLHKTQKDLHWKVKTPLVEGLKTTVDYIQNHLHNNSPKNEKSESQIYNNSFFRQDANQSKPESEVVKKQDQTKQKPEEEIKNIIIQKEEVINIDSSKTKLIEKQQALVDKKQSQSENEVQDKIQPQYSEPAPVKNKSTNSSQVEQSSQISPIKSKDFNNNKFFTVLKQIRFHKIVSLKMMIFILIVYALIIPVAKVFLLPIKLQQHFEESFVALHENNHQKAAAEALSAQKTIQEVRNILEAVAFVLPKKVIDSQFKNTFEQLDKMEEMALSLSNFAQGSILLQNEPFIQQGSLSEDFSMYFDLAYKGALASKLYWDNLQKRQQKSIVRGIDDFKLQWNFLQSASLWTRKSQLFIESFAPSQEKRTYIVVLLDNNIIRPIGGTVISVGKISIEKGSVTNIEMMDVNDFTASMTASLEAPATLPKDLGIEKWNIADAGIEQDFPSNARLITQFYQRLSPEDISGVIALDVQTLGDIVEAVNALSDSSDEKITFNKIEKRSFSSDEIIQLSKTAQITLSKLSTLSLRDWQSISQKLFEQMRTKHLFFYSDDEWLLSLAEAEGWSTPVVYTKKDRVGEKDDFIGLTDFIVTDENVTVNTQKGIGVQSLITEEGYVSSRMIVDYYISNEASASGIVKNKITFLLPSGVRVSKVQWGSDDITKQTQPFSSFGKSGYWAVVDQKIGERKQLQVEYVDSSALSFNEDGSVAYKLHLIKQPGVEAPVQIVLISPKNIKVVQTNGKLESENMVSYTTTLISDSVFETILQKI